MHLIGSRVRKDEVAAPAGKLEFPHYVRSLRHKMDLGDHIVGDKVKTR